MKIKKTETVECGTMPIAVQKSENSLFLRTQLASGECDGVKFELCLSVATLILQIDRGPNKWTNYIITPGSICEAILAYDASHWKRTHKSGRPRKVKP